jgi:hypothetical protein
VQQHAVKLVNVAADERFLRRHPQVLGVLVRAAEAAGS